MSRPTNGVHQPTEPGGNSTKLAIIGCGAITERYYLPALVRHRSIPANLVLVDRNLDRAQELASRFGIRECRTDFREILGQVDGAILAVPTHLHYPIAMEFLSRGTHVLCEKPLAESADRAQEMVDEARKTGAILAANYQRRLYPNLAGVQKLLADRVLGNPLSIQYYIGEKFDWPSVSGFYFNAPLCARGVLRDRGAHTMDVICWWLGGKPNVIRSQNDAFGGSEAMAYIKFEREQCVGEVLLTWLARLPCRFVVRCENGTIEGEEYDYQGYTLKMPSGRRARIKLGVGPQSYGEMAYAMVTGFIHAVAGQEKPLVEGSEVLPSLRLLDECYTAATRLDMPWYDIPEVRYAC